MKIHGGTIIDYLPVQQLDILPIWTSTNIGQIIYCISNDDFYLGTNSNWISLKTILTGISTGGTGGTGNIGNIGATGFSGNTGFQGDIGGTGPTGGSGGMGLIGNIGETGHTGATGLKGFTGGIGPIGRNTSSGGTGATGATGGVGSLTEFIGIIGEHEYGIILGFIEIEIIFLSLTKFSIYIKDVYNGFNRSLFELNLDECKNDICLNLDGTILTFLDDIVAPRGFKSAVSNIVYNDTTREIKVYSNDINNNIEYKIFDLLTKTYISIPNFIPNTKIIIQTKYIISKGPIPIYTLTVIIIHGFGDVYSYPIGIDCPKICNYSYDYNTVIILLAVPAPNYEFIEYTGADSTDDVYATVKLKSDRIVTVYFSKIRFRIYVTIIGKGKCTGDSGNINCSTYCIYIYESETTLDLTATPDFGWTLFSMTGYTSLVWVNVCRVYVDSDKYIVFEFIRTPCLLTVLIESPNFGIVTGNLFSTLPTFPTPPTPINCSDACTYKYYYGDVVSLNASPNPGYSFQRWSIDIVSINPTESIRMTRDKQVKAHFLPPPILTVIIVPDISLGSVKSIDLKIICPSTCSATYNFYDSVTLTATPTSIGEFVDWTGDIISVLNPVSIIIDSDKTVYANFKKLLKITVEIDPINAGIITCVPVTINCPTICVYYYKLNTIIQLTAIENPTYTFLNWTGEFTTPDPIFPEIIDVLVDKDKLLIAHFKTLPKLTVIIDPTGAGSVISNYPMGSIDCPTTCIMYTISSILVELECFEINSIFIEWVGNGTVDALNPKIYRIYLNLIDEIVIAKFKVNMLTVIISPSLKGQVTTNLIDICTTRCEYIFPYNVIVNLESINPGLDRTYIFDRWDGDFIPDIIKTKCTILMDNPKTITAVYLPIELIVMILPTIAAGQVISAFIHCPSTCSHIYEYNSTVILVAIDNPGYIFSRWIGYCTLDPLDPRICTVIMDNYQTIIAVFSTLPILKINLNPPNSGDVTTDNINCPTINCTNFYNFSESLTVVVIPRAGQTFVNWTGDISSTNMTINIIMDTDKTITANFLRSLLLEVFINSPVIDIASVTSEDTFIDCPAVICKSLYSPNSGIKLTALFTDPIPNPFIITCSFFNWTGDIISSDNPVDFTIITDMKVTANFKAKVHLYIKINPPNDTGSVKYRDPKDYNIFLIVECDRFWTILSDCQVYCVNDPIEYDLNHSAELYPIPIDPLYIFDSWSGDIPVGLEKDDPLFLRMDKQRIIIANFILKPNCKLTIIVDDPLYGEVEIYGIRRCPTDCIVIDTCNTTRIRLKAIEFTGGQFDNWSPSSLVYNDPITPVDKYNKYVDLNGFDRTLFANFSKSSGYRLTIWIYPQLLGLAIVTSNPAGINIPITGYASGYNWLQGTTVTVILQDQYKDTYSFQYFQNDDDATEPHITTTSFNITLDKFYTYTAVFKKPVECRLTIWIYPPLLGLAIVTSNPAGINIPITQRASGYNWTIGTTVTVILQDQYKDMYSFQYFQNNDDATEPHITTTSFNITLDKFYTYTAVFKKPVECRLTIWITSVGLATVTSNPAGINIPITGYASGYNWLQGTTVTVYLTDQLKGEYIFDYFYDKNDYKQPKIYNKSFTITLDKSYDYCAVFRNQYHYISVENVPNIRGLSTMTSTPPGFILSLTQYAASYRFLENTWVDLQDSFTGKDGYYFSKIIDRATGLEVLSGGYRTFLDKNYAYYAIFKK